MASEPRPSETCTGEVCVGGDVRPNVIAGGVGEDAVGATLNHDAAGPDAPDAPSSFSSDQPAKPDASLGQRHVASTRHQMTVGSSAPSILLGLAMLGGALAWRYCKHRMQQKEWQRASVGQLEKIRLRNADAPAHDHTRMEKEHIAIIAEDTPEVNATEADAPPNTRNDATRTNLECSQADASNICDEGNISSNDNSPGVPTSDRISRIRAKQQEQLERNAKSVQRERHLHQKKKKKALHNLLDHAAADAARERRQSLMAEESKLLESRRNEGQHQNALSELEELERVALLQQQDLDYQESLQQDQERAKLLAAKRDLRRRRQKALEQARDRLAVAGVQCDSILGLSASSSGGSEQKKCRVRLLVPSGLRVEGTFARANAIGLVYDLALLALDREHLLWTQEQSEIEDADLGDAGIGVEDDANDEQSDGDLQSTANSYASIRDEWRGIFHPFSVASTFPQRTFDSNLFETLEDGGLGQGATVMVVVESD